MNKLAFSILCAGLLGGCAARPAPAPQPHPQAINPAATAAAAAYVQSALSSSQFEIQSGQLALQTAQSPAVRALGQNLVNDHAQLASQLNAAAQAAGIAGPQVVMLPQHSAQLTQLQYARGSDFDASWRNMQVASLMQALDAHQRYAAAGEIPALRSVAASAVPVIQAELGQAQALSIAPPTYRPPSYRGRGERG